VLENIIILNEEKVNELTQQQSLLEKELNATETLIQNFDKEIEWHNELKKLTETKTQAEEILKRNSYEKENAQERLQKMQIVIELQEAKPMIADKERYTKDIDQKEKEIISLEKEIKKLNAEQQGLSEQQTKYGKDISLAEAKRKEDEPRIEEAKKLDVQIDNANNILNEAEKELKASKNTTQTKTKEQNEKDKEAKEIKVKIEKLNKWINENREWEKVAENKNLIISKLKDCIAKTKEQNDIEAKIKETKTKLEQGETALKQKQDELGKQEETAHKKQEELKTEEDIQKKIDIDKINLRQQAIEQKNEHLAEAKEIYKPLIEIKAKISQKKDDLDTNRIKLNKTTEDIKKSRREFEKIEIEKNLTDDLLNEAKIASTENVKKLREGLVAGKPCPVCGSTSHHPKAPLNEELTTLEKKAKELKQEYERLMQLLSKLKQEQKTIQENLLKLEKEINQDVEALDRLTEKWQQNIIAKECLSIDEQLILAWIDGEISNNKKELKELNAQESQHRELSKKILERQKEIEISNQQIQDVKSKISEINNDLNLLTQSIKQLNSSLEQVEKELQSKLNEANEYINIGNQQKELMQDKEEFIRQIEKHANDWKDKTSTLQELEPKLKVINANLQNLTQQLAEALDNEKQKQDKYDKQNNNVAELKTTRQKIFDGKDIELIKKEIEDEIKRITKLKEEAFEKIQNINKNLNNKQGILSQIKEDKNTISQNIQNTKSQINDWLNSYNQTKSFPIDEQLFYELLAYNKEWIEQERLFFKELENNFITAQTILKERQEKLSEHSANKLSELDLETINAQKEEQVNIKKEKTNQCNDIKYNLKQDKENKAKHQSIIQKIEQQKEVVKKWGVLNELIGSANGQKFRQIAQEYTLDFLLNYANIHINDLAKRYRLKRIEDSLALQIIDTYMGNDVRSVNSLSGGETFLVSLSLALGLASLSSNRMNIESLFIDEGFGSLDQKTLSIVMNALEGLHNQGRKVGVISHVQEMVERIPAQIKVERIATGKSKVSVIRS